MKGRGRYPAQRPKSPGKRAHAHVAPLRRLANRNRALQVLLHVLDGRLKLGVVPRQGGCAQDREQLQHQRLNAQAAAVLKRAALDGFEQRAQPLGVLTQKYRPVAQAAARARPVDQGKLQANAARSLLAEHGRLIAAGGGHQHQVVRPDLKRLPEVGKAVSPAPFQLEEDHVVLSSLPLIQRAVAVGPEMLCGLDADKRDVLARQLFQRQAAHADPSFDRILQ